MKPYKLSELPFLIADRIGNPVDAIDSFNTLAIKYLEQGKINEAKECLGEISKVIEKTKQVIDDFRSGKIKIENG
jgi:PHP family Zn ribbon phosphoesterase